MTFIAVFILIGSELFLLLAHMGRFSAYWIIPAGLAAVLVCFRKTTFPRKRFFYILPILLLPAVLFFRPYHYMDGGWDPGNYINTGVHIARSGGVEYFDDMLKETSGAVRADGSGLKYPGLYIKDADKGVVVPQFFHLYPVWIAVFYKLFGLGAVFYVNPVFALLSVFLLFLIAEKTLGKTYGLIAALLLGFNVIQIWNARFPTSEILAQFLVLSGIYFWLIYLERNERFYAFFAGFSFGMFLFTGITSLIVIPILAVYFFGRSKKSDLWFIAPLVLLSFHLLFQLVFYSSIYFESVLRFFARKEIYFVVFAFITAAVVFKLRPGMFRWFAALIPLMFLYGYYVRPKISGSIEALNLVELGHWLSLLGMAFAVIGLVLIISKEKNEAVLLFIALALLSAVFFIYNKRMISRYPFALRRYIPLVIPAYCFAIVYLKKIKKWLVFIAAPLALFIPLWQCADIIGVKDHRSWLCFWESFAGKMDDNALYISNSYKWARPLNDIFGKKVITFTGFPPLSGEKICGTAKKMLDTGEDVYYISHLGRPYCMTVDFRLQDSLLYRGEYMEHMLTFPPRRREQEARFNIYRIVEIDRPDEPEYTVYMDEEDIGLLKGFDQARRFGGIDGPARWTFSEAQLVLPWFGDAVSQTLALRAGGMPGKAGETVISLYIDGQSIAENIALAPDMAEYVFVIPPDKIDSSDAERVTLTIKSNTWDPDKHGIRGFPSGLGILVEWVKIRR